ncbi:hypothetical protein CC99x_000360 [Candidatus Berkiella cookevillensis]|uniref:Colicin-E3 n=1 Tax=Candidatus Berkiella cookevillensis TaxID=437022 RepID=A0A0Q9YHT8_9GAMM|nr:colicin E3/pyocin S6 family cytotoxin [Candidatus Berkiella cookevillensis]MCS5707345.1 hypothetical protein [Candidatus Berkiella cookevillensis]
MPKNNKVFNPQLTNLPLLEEQLKAGLKPNDFYHGRQTLLDIALIHEQYAAADLLKRYGAIGYLDASKIQEQRRKTIEQSALISEYSVKCHYDKLGKASLDIEELDRSTSTASRCVRLSGNDFLKEGYLNQSVAIIRVQDKLNIVILEKRDPSKVVAVFQFDENFQLNLLSANAHSHNISIESEGQINICEKISAKKLSVIADTLHVQKAAFIQGCELKIDAKRSVRNQGVWLTETLALCSFDFINEGHIRLTEKYSIDCGGRFEQKNELIAVRQGSVKAHVVENAATSTLLIAEGELKLYGKAYVKNSGSILADYLVLDSEHLVNNQYGALIKAVTCIVPPKPNQFNNAGFYLVGRKNHLSILDKVLNYATSAVEITGMLLPMPSQSLKNLRTSLLVAKTLYHSAGILSRLYQGKYLEVSNSEYVHFFLDHVLPSIGGLSGNDEKTKFVCNVFYQLWGWYLGEDELIDRSLTILELIISAAATLGKGKLSAEDISLLQNVSRKIMHSRNTFKFAKSAIEVISAYSLGTAEDTRNANDTIAALSESALRDMIDRLSPDKIFGIEFNPKDLALFVLNGGHQQSHTEIIKRTLYSLIYALHKSEKISDSLKAEYQLYAQSFFSGKNWLLLYQRYQEGKITYAELTQQLFNNLTIYASYRATINQIEASAAKVLETESLSATDEAESRASEQLESNLEKTIEDEEQAEPEVHSVLEDGVTEEENQEEFELIEDTTYAPTEEEVLEKIHENAEAVRISYGADVAKVDVIIDVDAQVEKILHPQQDTDTDTETPESLNFGEQLDKLLSNGINTQHVQAMMEVQRALDGDYAAQGYLGVFASTLHNHGLLDSVGNAHFSIEVGNNSNSMRATENILISGHDISVRDEDNKRIAALSNNEANSSFLNEASGTITSGNDIRFSGVGQLENRGSVQADAHVYINDAKSVVNHEKASIIGVESVDVVADVEVQNIGYVSGKNVSLEGTQKEAHNAGNIVAQEEIVLKSQQKINHTSGRLSAQKIILAGTEIEKSGNMSAVLVKTTGYDTERPESITWRSGEGNDNIYALSLNPQKSFQCDADAFNGTQITDLQLNEAKLGQTQWPSLSPDFKNIFQLQLPYSERSISLESLPQLNPAATFILNAPGTRLEAVGDVPVHYANTLRYKGDAFRQTGSHGFKEAWFDTKDFDIEGGTNKLYLEKGGVIQSKTFNNKGNLHADGIIHWNVESFTNDAQIRHYIEEFIHSKENYVTDYVDSTAIVENSGSIYATGHRGHIADFQSTGGKFRSGTEGNYLYVDNAHLRPLFTQSGVYSRGVIEDVGWSWHSLPKANNAQFSSEGETVLYGTGKMIASGADVWGDKGTHLYFNEGVHDDKVESREYVIQQAKERSGGKNRHVTVPYTQAQVVSQNYISANDGPITIASADGSIFLKNTILSTPYDASLIARDKIWIDGAEVSIYERAHYKERGLKRRKTVRSDSHSVEVHSSYLFIGGTLVVSCLDFQLSAVSGVIGNADVTAFTTNLSAQEESFKNTTTTKTFSIGLPGENLIELLSSHNAKAIFSSLVKNCGWDIDELTALANAKSIAEIPAPLLNCARDAWNLTAMVAHACNEFGGSPAKFIGSITDQMGLTTQLSNGMRIPTPNVSLNWSKTKEKTEQSHMVASNLYIGGTFKLFGSKLIIADGSKIDANVLLLSLAKGIEMTKGVDKYSYQSVTKSGSLTTDLSNPIASSVSASRNSVRIESETVDLALLQGREAAYISVGESIVGEGRIIADKGKVSAPHIELVSAQSSYTESCKASSVGIGANAIGAGVLPQASINASQSRVENTVTEKAGIFIENGTLVTNECNLEKGSVISVKRLERLDGKEGLPVITGSMATDHNTQTQSSVGITLAHFDAEPGADMRYSSDRAQTIHQPSVYAENIVAGDFVGINTDKAQESIELESCHRGYAVAGFVPNKEKYEKQAEDIQKASNKALHFLFKHPASKSTQQNSLTPAPVEERLTIDESAVQTLEQTSESSIENDIRLDLNAYFMRESAQDGIYEKPKEASDSTEIKEKESEAEDLREQSQIEQTETPSNEKEKLDLSMPGMAKLYSLPDVEFYLAQLSPEELRYLTEMVVAYENGDPEGKIEKLRQAYASSQKDGFSKFLEVFNPFPKAHAIAPALPFATIYLLGALGILTYKATLEQSNFDYAMNEPEDVNSDFPALNHQALYFEIGMWLKNKFTSQPDLPDSAMGFPIHESDDVSYITPIPDAEAYGKQLEHIPIIDNLGQILSQPVPEKQSGADIYSQPLPPNSLKWNFDAYKVNGEEFIKTKDHDYYSAADYLEGFPGSYRVQGKTPMGDGKKLRRRWKTEDGKILEWDYQHGEVEMYTEKGKHLGAYDPDTGKKVKEPNNERNIKKFL